MVRLLVYIVLILCISITVTGLFFAMQSSSSDKRQIAEQIGWMHEQSLQRLQQTFSELDHMAMMVSNDYAIQRMTEESIVRDSIEERALRDYTEYLIRQQLLQLPYIEDMCITMDEGPYYFCTKSDLPSPLLKKPMPILQKRERILLPIEKDASGIDNSPLNAHVFYSTPLVDRRTNILRGSVQLLINLDNLMSDIYRKWPLLRNQLLDVEGAIVYDRISAEWIVDSKESEWRTSNKTAQNLLQPELLWKERTVISQQKLDLPGTVWVSKIETWQNVVATQKSVVRNSIGFVTLLLLIVCVSSIFLFRHYFMRPMQHLRGLMHRVELRDFKAYWVRKSSPEWNELGESYNQMLNRMEELIKQVKREEALKKEAEMEALQYQLNPHFLYNTLNTIKWVAKMHKTPQIAEVVTSLVRLLQASLGKKGDFITIREEIGLIHDYMEIQSFRYGDQVQLECEIDPLVKGCLVPRMILQPLIENAIIHGIAPGRQPGVIRIRIWLEVERDMLYCQVEDNGVGMPVEEWNQENAGHLSSGTMRERMSGIGLRHIREKIKLYYGNGYSMHIVSKPKQGTTIRLTMPAHQSEVG